MEFDLGMANLCDVVSFLDEQLRISEIPDYPGAYNGLQLENGGEVRKVATAVDASFPVIEKAIAAEADLLVVHHGLFWHGVRMMTGVNYTKFKSAIDAGLAIYSSHIPLDIHPEWGNNALLSEKLGIEEGDDFFPWKGIQLGRKGVFRRGDLGELRDQLAEVVGGEVLMRGEADSDVGVVGLITGGAGSEVESIARAGIDTFITGEGPHWSHPLAEELGLNVLYAGHYATETFGVRRIGELLAQDFCLSNAFIEHPTGL